MEIDYRMSLIPAMTATRYQLSRPGSGPGDDSTEGEPHAVD
jgi:hypothetical protein